MMVVIVLALIGTALLCLTSASNSMLFEANSAYLKACERNLITSGLAWAKTNIQDGDSQYFDKMTELYVVDMNIPNSSLHVTISGRIDISDISQEVQISASCSRGRLNLTSDEAFKIEQ